MRVGFLIRLVPWDCGFSPYRARRALAEAHYSFLALLAHLLYILPLFSTTFPLFSTALNPLKASCFLLYNRFPLNTLIL